MPGSSFNWLSMILTVGVFYFFMIMPERKKQKAMRSMLDNVKAGDKIITRGGIYGVIISVTDDSMIISTGPSNVELELSKLSISSVIEASQSTVVEDAAEIEETLEKDDATTEGTAEEKTE
jgi:preprotein translocase subunit YajC